MELLKTSDEVRARIKQIKRALNETPGADRSLTNLADDIETKLNTIQIQLRGDNALRARNENVPVSIFERVQSIIGDSRTSTQRPTGTNEQSYAVAAEEFRSTLDQLRTLVSSDLNKLESDMEAAGAPWTPGRIPTWQEQ